MKPEKKALHEQDVKVVISKLLRIGVLTSAFVAIVGGTIFFIQHPGMEFSYKTFNSEPGRLTQVHTIIREAFKFNGRAVIQFGILILIATPVLRVLLSLIGFVIEKDKVFVVITAIVLGILLYSLLG